MERLIFAVVLSVAAYALIGAVGVSGSRCSPPVALTSGYSDYFQVGNQNVDEVEVSFEPDASGSETVAVLGLDFCSRTDGDGDGTDDTLACNPYNFDSDADGLGDTNLLDASTIEKSGLKGISGFQFLRVYASTNPSGTDEPEFTICRRNN